MLSHIFIPNRGFMVKFGGMKGEFGPDEVCRSLICHQAHQKVTIRIYHTLIQARIWSYPISDLISHNIKTDDRAYHRLIRNLGAIAIQRRRPGIVTSKWQETTSNSRQFM